MNKFDLLQKLWQGSNQGCKTKREILMNQVKFLPKLMIAGVVAVSSAIFSTPAQAGRIIQITNTGPIDWTFSDLIVFSELGTKFEILEPDNPNDDETLSPGQSVIKTAPFQIESYFISTQIGDSELESYVLEVKKKTPRKLTFFDNDQTEVFTSVDLDLITNTPLNVNIGDILNVDNGTLFIDNSPVDGYFIGTSADFDNGGVSMPFTGTVEVAYNSIMINSPIPEPGTILGLLAIGGLGLGLKRKKQS